MKRFTLMALCALTLCGSASAARPAKAKARAKAVSTIAHKPAAAAAEKAPWCPLKQQSFDWEYEDETNPAEGNWVASDIYELTYTQAGKVATDVTTTPEGDVLKDVYTYNADGMMTSKVTTKSVDGAEFEPSEEVYRQYDNVVKNFVVSNEQYIWYGGDKMTSNTYKYNITRDDAGNVTLCERAVLFQGVYDPTFRTAVEYGPDGKASKITCTSLTYDGVEYSWVTESVYSDLEWERTDGQILSTENLMFGNNRLSSATITIGEDEGVMKVKYTYDGVSYDCRGTMEMDGESVSIIAQYNDLGNGGYKLYTLQDLGYWTESETEVEEHDSFGLITTRYVQWTDFSYSEYYEYIEGLVRYDDNTGYPEMYTLTHRDIDEDSPTYGETIYDHRIIYEGNADLAGISDIVADADDADAPVEFYTLQGMRIDRPAAGQLVIRRQGKHVSKVLVK